MVISCQLPVETVVECVRGQLTFHERSGASPPLGSPGIPRKRASSQEPTRRLGDDVVIGRRAAAGKGRKELLVPGNLSEGIVIVLEQVADLGPVIEQPADPGPGDQADSSLNTARPMHSGEEWVCTPPRAKLIPSGLGVALVLREPPGGRQHSEVMVPGELPNLLDIARLGLVAMVNAKCQPVVRRASPGHRIVKPIWVGAVGTTGAQHRPCSG